MPRHTACPICEYDVTGITAVNGVATCPECGRSFEAEYSKDTGIPYWRYFSLAVLPPLVLWLISQIPQWRGMRDQTFGGFFGWITFAFIFLSPCFSAMLVFSKDRRNFEISQGHIASLIVRGISINLLGVLVVFLINIRDFIPPGF
jgi:hypothetical protein